jgi:hypothetical protein
MACIKICFGCTSLGGDLASIHSTDELEEFKSYMSSIPGFRTYNNRVWMGGTDAYEEGKFKWTDGASSSIFCTFRLSSCLTSSASPSDQDPTSRMRIGESLRILAAN